MIPYRHEQDEDKFSVFFDFPLYMKTGFKIDDSSALQLKLL